MTKISLSHRNIALSGLLTSFLVLLIAIGVSLYIFLQSQRRQIDQGDASQNPQLDALNQVLELINTKTTSRD